jgi:hypothetical protein
VRTRIPDPLITRNSRSPQKRAHGLSQSASRNRLRTYAYITPLFGAVMGATVLGEPLWAGAFVGAALVLGAVALELRGR